VNDMRDVALLDGTILLSARAFGDVPQAGSALTDDTTTKQPVESSFPPPLVELPARQAFPAPAGEETYDGWLSVIDDAGRRNDWPIQMDVDGVGPGVTGALIDASSLTGDSSQPQRPRLIFPLSTSCHARQPTLHWRLPATPDGHEWVCVGTENTAQLSSDKPQRTRTLPSNQRIGAWYSFLAGRRRRGRTDAGHHPMSDSFRHHHLTREPTMGSGRTLNINDDGHGDVTSIGQTSVVVRFGSPKGLRLTLAQAAPHSSCSAIETNRVGDVTDNGSGGCCGRIAALPYARNRCRRIRSALWISVGSSRVRSARSRCRCGNTRRATSSCAG
jgi:hypothetical protein